MDEGDWGLHRPPNRWAPPLRLHLTNVCAHASLGTYNNRQLPFWHDRLRDRLHPGLCDLDRRDQVAGALARPRLHVHLHHHRVYYPPRLARPCGGQVLRVVSRGGELCGAGDDVRVGKPDLRGRPRGARRRARVDEYVEQRPQCVVAARVLPRDGRAAVHEGRVGDDWDERRDARRDVGGVVPREAGEASEGQVGWGGGQREK